MAHSKSPATDGRRRRPGCIDQALTTLVDAIVQAVDITRDYEIDRLRSALEAFGGTDLFDSELGLNGVASIDEECICGGGGF